MISGRLTMRAQVERGAGADRDAWNQPIAGELQPVGKPLRCFVWSNAAREDVTSDRSASVELLRGLFPIGADLSDKDQLVSVTNRQGTVVHCGRLSVEGPPQFKHTHLEAALRRIS